jgi:formamidopyrimidine-DNA glycosylase
MVGRLGPGALDVSLEEFRGLLKGRRGAIKTFLLDQDRIAGIGNVYIQDPLFKARLHPLRSIQTLTDDEIAALWQAIRDTLQESIDAGGAPFELNLYGQKGGWSASFLVGYREGQPCPECGTAVVKIKTGSTASYICPSCQSLGVPTQVC